MPECLQMSDTKDKIIVLADQLIRSRGYNAFSYKDIADPLQVKNAAIHYHFQTKDALGISVIDQTIAAQEENRRKWAKLPEDQQLRLFIDAYGRRNKEEGLLCLMGALSPDYITLSPEMQLKLKEMGNIIIDWVANCLENGRKNNYFHFQGDAQDRAYMVMSNLLAALQLSRVVGKHIFSRVKQQLIKDLT
ncbi:TetR family transcriptional regulator [Chitinophaga sp. MD30]|nr:TetR family transcriptional regulator [Chitinophaga sp. MD30]